MIHKQMIVPHSNEPVHIIYTAVFATESDNHKEYVGTKEYVSLSTEALSAQIA